MERTRRDTLLGLVFFGTLAFLLWATVNLTDISLGKVPPLLVALDDAGGLRAGSNVLVLGKINGKVGEVGIDYANATHPAQLKLLLQEPIPFTDKYRIEIQPDGLLGAKLVYIDPGRGAPIAVDKPLFGTSQKNLFERLGDVTDGKGVLGENVNGAVTAFRRVFESLHDDRNSIGRLLVRSDLYDEVLQSVQRFNSIMESIQSGQSTFGRLAVDTAMGERVQFFIDNLARVSEALTGVQGTIPMLLNDPGTASDMRAIVADVRAMIGDARAGRGVVGKLLADEALATQFMDAVTGFNRLMAKANDPEAGLVGAAFSDPGTAESFKLLVANLRTVSERLTGTDTLLGILISDKDVGVRFRRIITQVSRALEDAREAAPISSLVQVVLGLF